MDEKIMDEIRKAADILGMSEEEALKKFNDICTQNDVDATEEPLLARGLWRQYFSGAKLAQQRPASSSSDDEFWKPAFGFFISLDEARDMMAIQRDRIVGEYHRDSTTTYELGKVALFTPMTGDKYEGQMMKDGEEVIRVFGKLPENHVELDDGRYLVPLDSTEKYGTFVNKNYGKPLAKSEFRRSGIFIGEVAGKLGKYFFSYKGPHCVDFNPKTFEFVSFSCITNSTHEDRIHGGTDMTVGSLVYNSAKEEPVDVSDVSIQDELMSHSEANFSPLIDLDRYHSTVTQKNYNDRFVFTDGSVTNINMNPTKNGNRIMTLDDLNTDFDFNDDGFSGVTCWIPPSMEIDFGIGSNVIVVGRTSQGSDSEGNIQSVTINVTGIHVLKARGGNPDKIEFTEEEDEDWFFS